MQHHLSELPYSVEALEPHISRETFHYHYGKHHQTYVNTLNELIRGTSFEGLQLEDIITTSSGPIFHSAAQHWNHTFFWNCLKADAGGNPTGEVAGLLLKKWPSFEAFKEDFSSAAIGNFGSGWTWLVADDAKNLEILSTGNADTPLCHGRRAILTIDVWEHAYYIDYRHARAEFVKAFWNLVNWDFVNSNLSEADPGGKKPHISRSVGPDHLVVH